MKFYVMGRAYGKRLELLSGKEFSTLEEAQHYIKSVSPSWNPLIVQAIA